MKQSISRRFLIGLIIFTIALTTCMSVVIALFFVRRTQEKYEYIGTSVTETIAARIDGDKIAYYLETDQPDDYYDDVLDQINTINDTFGCLYTYVAIPTEENMLYIWSNGFSGEETIGFTTPFSPGGEDWVKGKMTGEEEEILRYVKDPDFGYIASAAAPIKDSNGETVAMVLSDFSVNEIRQTVTQVVVNIFLYLVIMMTIFIVIYFRYISDKLVIPIRLLTTATKSMTENIDKDVDTYLDIHTGDELEVLADSFQKMGLELREYISDNLRITAEKERIGTELSMATRIQESMLPRIFPAFPERDDFDIYASMDPAKEVGGDFYDYFLIDDDHLCMVIADVSGKGVPAALFMMISKVILSNNAMAKKSPAQVLMDTNDAICRNNPENMFVTVWLGILELSTGVLTASNAGHEFPVIQKPNGVFEFYEDSHGLVIGVMEGVPYQEYQITLEPGSRIFVYTDGVPEAMNSEEELFGLDRTKEALNRDPEVSPEQVLKNVRRSVDDFVKAAAQFDDLTMLCMHYIGPKADV